MNLGSHLHIIFIWPSLFVIEQIRMIENIHGFVFAWLTLVEEHSRGNVIEFPAFRFLVVTIIKIDSIV